MAPINQFIDSFNKGDVAGAAAAHAATDLTIIDEVPPHIWRGPGAFNAWVSDLMANDKAHGMSGENVVLGTPLKQVISGDKGYVVLAVTYTYKQNGVNMSEPAEMTFALVSGAGGWKIAGWAWDGTEPQKAK
ncbi:MAG: nuclear transport factor 2 family protein [Caulobacterales bacterium]